MNSAEVYQPQDVPQSFGPEIWLVNGPIVTMNLYGLKFPFPTRMTILRLENGDLFLHSPTRLSPELKKAVMDLGCVRHLVAPNKLHSSFIQEWAREFPDATVWLAPGTAERALKDGIVIFSFQELTSQTPPEWEREIKQVIFSGSRYMKEVVFFHALSRTVVFTDFIQNFELNRVSGFPWLVLKLAGAGKAPFTPPDLRATFHGGKDEAIKSLREILSWHPENIILSHGACLTGDGTTRLRKIFSWVGSI